MSREILVPVDGSEPAWDALDFALERHPDADVTAYYVVDVATRTQGPPLGTAPVYADELYEAEEEYAESVLEEAAERGEEYDATVETEYERGMPRDAILEYADEHDVDQLIVGSHGRSGLERVLIGSVAEKLTRHSPVPVTVVRPGTQTD